MKYLQTPQLTSGVVYSEFHKSNKFYKLILDKFCNRQTTNQHISSGWEWSEIAKVLRFKCEGPCNRYIYKRKKIKQHGKYKCCYCAFNWRDYTLLNTYYTTIKEYEGDYKRDIAFHLDILETNIYDGVNIFGEYGSKRLIENLHFEKRFVYRYRNELRKKTSLMFWGVFALDKNENEFYLPTELIIAIIYQTMYWIPTINY